MKALDHALFYIQNGFSVIPIIEKDKKPAIKTWKYFQQHIPSEQQIRSWFSPGKHSNLAVILGGVSGNLYARDFDKVSSYNNWASHYLKTVPDLPRVASARGHHVYFRGKHVLRTQKFKDGELRGEGAYLILPPSIHPSGHVYNWTVPITKEVPTIDPRAIELLRDWSCTESTEITEKTEITDAYICGSGFASVVVSNIEEAVSLATPKEKCQNHKCLFTLARAVKSLEKSITTRYSDQQLREIFKMWYLKAQKYLKEDQSMDEYWFEFFRELSSGNISSWV